MTIKQGSTVRLVSDAEEIMVGQGFGWNPDMMGALTGKSLRVVYIPSIISPRTLVGVVLDNLVYQVPLQVLTQVEGDAFRELVRGDLVQLVPFDGATVFRPPEPRSRIYVFHGGFDSGIRPLAQVKPLDAPGEPFLLVPYAAMRLVDKAPVIVRFDYYKRSGKWYSEGCCTMEGIRILQGGTPYIHEVVDRVVKWRGANVDLPGLSTSWNEGFVLLRCVTPEGGSHLLPPVRS